MLRQALKLSFSTQPIITKLPKAPTLLSGELETFRFDGEHGRIYDGYSLDELYGSKIGVKHSPAVKAEMRKYSFRQIEIPSPPCFFLDLESALSST